MSITWKWNAGYQVTNSTHMFFCTVILNIAVYYDCATGLNKQHAVKRHKHRRRQRRLERAQVKGPEGVVQVPIHPMGTQMQGNKKSKGAGGSFSVGNRRGCH